MRGLLAGRSPAPTPPPGPAEAPLPRLSADGPIRFLLEAVDRVLEGCAGGATHVLGRWVEFEQWVCVGRKDARVQVDRRGRRRFRIEVHLDRGGKRSVASVEQVVRPREDVPVEELAARLSRRALERLAATQPRSRSCPVVFAPGVGALVIHELVGHALEADTVLRGASALATRTGDVGSSEITVIDDPPLGPSGWRCDDEGEAATRVELLLEGRVRGHLHDQGSARLAGSSATGHGRRSSFREPVRPRMGCTFLLGREMDPAEVVASVDDGLYVRRMETANVDARTGEAFFRVTDADRIVRGRIDAPLDAFLLRLEGSAALSTLSHVANDLTFDTCVGSCVRDGQPLPTTVGAPTFRIGMARVVAP